jgi:hypothetical protein
MSASDSASASSETTTATTAATTAAAPSSFVTIRKIPGIINWEFQPDPENDLRKWNLNSSSNDICDCCQREKDVIIDFLSSGKGTNRLNRHAFCFECFQSFFQTKLIIRSEEYEQNIEDLIARQKEIKRERSKLKQKCKTLKEEKNKNKRLIEQFRQEKEKTIEYEQQQEEKAKAKEKFTFRKVNHSNEAFNFHFSRKINDGEKEETILLQSNLYAKECGNCRNCKKTDVRVIYIYHDAKWTISLCFQCIRILFRQTLQSKEALEKQILEYRAKLELIQNQLDWNY